MCDPLTMAAASFATSAAQAGMGFMAEKQQADAQRDYAQQTATAAAKATMNQYDSLNIRTVQEQQAAYQQKHEQGLEVARQAAAVEVAAGAGGVSGLAVDHVLRDYYAQAGRRSAAIDTNLQMTTNYLQGEKRSAQAGGQSQANSVPLPETPSPVPTILNVFGSGLQSYSTYKRLKD